MYNNLFSLKGKTVILTGATGYFGRYFSHGLIEYGARVILIGRDKKKLQSLQQELLETNKAASISCIVLDQYDRYKAVQQYREIIKTEKSVDVLVNNAYDISLKTGFNDPSGRMEHSSFEQLEASFESGIYWAIQATQEFGHAMKMQKSGGSIINICSMYGIVSPHPSLYKGTNKFNPPGYSMAKGGLLQFTKYSASFLAPNVRVNAISPGAFPNTETKTYNALSDNDKDEFLQRLIDRTLLGRPGHPKDLIGALVFLASDASSYITGQNIVVDGGWTVT